MSAFDEIARTSRATTMLQLEESGVGERHKALILRAEMLMERLEDKTFDTVSRAKSEDAALSTLDSLQKVRVTSPCP
jgi:hypothetical protein